ncbi:MAG: glycerol-3-phosphate dehydrogenase/oxidase [Bacteroidota bacterium]|nr:glycerol-3-phosphate dehydrogenase/oxidase [Bacteroidota bacterium]
MKRNQMLQALQEGKQWDIVIVGGGATGLGAAVDAASRGYTTLLVEQHDFGKGTSSRSTKLLHGGVRYLQQGNIKLVMEALRERGKLLKNAPHISSIQAFVLPVYSWWKKWYYAAGLKLYDLLSGKLSVGATEILSAKKTKQLLLSAEEKKLKGGIRYYDGQFDDARLCIDLAATAHKHGAVILNYMRAKGFEKEAGKITAVQLQDSLSNQIYTARCKVVINATGVFTDSVLQMDDHLQHQLVLPSQGVHIVIDKKFFPGTDALIIPHTDDGRVLFAVPWHDKVVVGTTDTPVDLILSEPEAFDEEIAFIIHHFNRYNRLQIQYEDVLSVFAGLRPLVHGKEGSSTATLSRDHTIVVSKSGLVSITGGKWTTYRRMAEDAVNNASFVGKLHKASCVTDTLAIGEWKLPVDRSHHWHVYGIHAAAIQQLMEEDISLQEKIHSQYPYTKGEVVWIIRNELAETIEDILARRIRLLFLDAKAAMEAAPVIAILLAAELKKEEGWMEVQLNSFLTLAQRYTAY